MNFLRQQADAFLAQHHMVPNENEEKQQNDEAPLAPEVTDPEMDAAIEEMKERLANLRAQTTLQRMKNTREMEQLQTKYKTSSQRLKDKVETVLQAAHMAPYLAATKEIQKDFIRTGVVVTLQARLCLHIHGMCAHNEQLVLIKRDTNDIIFWFEDMVKKLRRDQADHEMQLMNELVQAKIRIGELVDAKKIKERSSSLRGSLNSTRSSLRGSLRMGNATNNTSSSNTMSALKQARIMRGRRRSSLKERADDMPIHENTSKLRTMRKISTRGGVAFQKNGSMRNLQKAESIRNMKNFRVSSQDSNKNDNTEATEATAASPTTSPVSVRKVHGFAGDDDNKLAQPLSPGAGDEDDNQDIAARRAARAAARAEGPSPTREGRPIRRGVQRTRSRSLTSMAEGGKRGGRRKLLNKPSQDDTNVSRRRISNPQQQQQLLVGFPRAHDDSESMRKRRGSTRELLRGFSPPPLRKSQTTTTTPTAPIENREEGSLTSTLRSWVGNMTVMLQQPQETGMSSRQHKVALVG